MTKVIGKICPRSLPYRVGGMCEEDKHCKETRQKYATGRNSKENIENICRMVK